MLGCLWRIVHFMCLKNLLNDITHITYATQCFHLEYSEIRDTRHIILRTCYRHRENHWRVHRIETHTTCTHAFLMPLMRVSLCNDLSCYPLESLRTEIHPRQPSIVWMPWSTCRGRLHHKKYIYSFLHFWSHIKDKSKKKEWKKKYS